MIRGLILSATFLLLAACGSAPLHKNRQALVVAIESSPTNLDPRLATDANSLRIIQLIFNGLMGYDADMRLKPELAEGYRIVNDTTYIFTIRRGVRFQHGRELTAHDVKYTVESILDPKLKSPNFSTFERVKEVKVLGRYEISFTLKEPFAPFLSALTIGIVPEELAEGPGFSRNPVGTGPFRLKGAPSPDKLILSANEDYFGGKPRLEEIIVKVVPDDTVRVMELMGGSVDLIINAIPPDMLPLLKRRGLEVHLSPGNSYSYLGFNLNDPILRDRRVRSAIAYAIDREVIIRHLLKGTAQPASGVLPPTSWAYEPDVPSYPYDPERARALLDEAGYPDPPGPRPRFRLLYKTSQNELRRLIGEAMMAQLNEVGIDVEMRSYEWGTFFSDIKSGNFQIYTLTWVGIADPDVLYYIFHSENIPPRGANRGRYKNLEVDRLLTEARARLDIKERRERYSQVQKILAQDLPYVSLWYGINVAAATRRVKGFHLNAAGDFMPLKEAWVEG